MGNVVEFDQEDDENIIRTVSVSKPVAIVAEMQSILTEVPGYGTVGILFFPGERQIRCNNQKMVFTDEEWEAYRPQLEKLFK
jgi:hypothetical protein